VYLLRTVTAHWIVDAEIRAHLSLSCQSGLHCDLGACGQLPPREVWPVSAKTKPKLLKARALYLLTSGIQLSGVQFTRSHHAVFMTHVNIRTQIFLGKTILARHWQSNFQYVDLTHTIGQNLIFQLEVFCFLSLCRLHYSYFVSWKPRSFNIHIVGLTTPLV